MGDVTAGGTYSMELKELRAELDDHAHGGQRMGITVLYTLLCRVLVQRRRPDAVLAAVDAAQKIGRETGELLFEGDLCRMKARALLMDGSLGGQLAARPMLEHALAVARRQNARSIELLVARDLADLLSGQGARGQARVVWCRRRGAGDHEVGIEFLSDVNFWNLGKSGMTPLLTPPGPS